LRELGRIVRIQRYSRLRLIKDYLNLAPDLKRDLNCDLGEPRRKVHTILFGDCWGGGVWGAEPPSLVVWMSVNVIWFWTLSFSDGWYWAGWYSSLFRIQYFFCWFALQASLIEIECLLAECISYWKKKKFGGKIGIAPTSSVMGRLEASVSFC
jgi:hypothetical protein